MIVTAEIRWFGRGLPPADLLAWFERASLHARAPNTGQWSEHRYLYEAGQQELGIKQRGTARDIEIKGLVMAELDQLDTAPLAGRIELWSKWSSTLAALQGRPTIALRKRRRLRHYHWQTGALDEVFPEEPLADGRTAHCHAELTDLLLAEHPWWTLGLEASGAFADLVPQVRTVAAHLARFDPPALAPAGCLSYPAWLQLHAGAASTSE